MEEEVHVKFCDHLGENNLYLLNKLNHDPLISLIGIHPKEIKIPKLRGQGCLL